MKYFLILYLLICAAYLCGFYKSYPKKGWHLVDIIFTFILCVIGFLPIFVYSNLIKMKKLLTIIIIAFSLSASAQEEKIKVQLKHSVNASGAYALSKDTAGAYFNGELTYFLGGLDFQCGITLGTNDNWNNIFAGVKTTTRVFNINDNIKISALLGAGAMVVNGNNPKLHPLYVEAGGTIGYKLSEGWIFNTYYKYFNLTKGGTPQLGVGLMRNFN